MKESIIIGISGASGSGKSLLAKTIVDELGSDEVVVIPEDCYYKDQSHLTPENQKLVNYDHPDAFDHALLCEHLITLQNGGSVDIPQYDHRFHKRLNETKLIANHRIIVLEGILLFVVPFLRELLNMCIYVDAPLDICLIRRLQRDIVERNRDTKDVLRHYETSVRPMFLQFIEPSKRYADIIVPRGGENRIAIDLIKAKIRELLN